MRIARTHTTIAIVRAALAAMAASSAVLCLLFAVLVGTIPRGIPGHDPNGMLLLVLISLVQAILALTIAPPRDR